MRRRCWRRIANVRCRLALCRGAPARADRRAGRRPVVMRAWCRQPATGERRVVGTAGGNDRRRRHAWTPRGPARARTRRVAPLRDRQFPRCALCEVPHRRYRPCRTTGRRSSAEARGRCASATSEWLGPTSRRSTFTSWSESGADRAAGRAADSHRRSFRERAPSTRHVTAAAPASARPCGEGTQSGP